VAAAIVGLAVVVAAALIVTLSSRGTHPTAAAARAASRAAPKPGPTSTAQPAATATVPPTPRSSASPTVSPTATASATATPSATPHGTSPSPTPAPGRVVHDATGDISVLVPDNWTSVTGDGWHPTNIPPIPNGTDIGPGLNASTNVPAWFTDWTTPGMFVGASRQLTADGYTPATLLQHIGFTDCSLFSSQPYALGRWTGTLDTQTCAGSATRLWNIAMWPSDHSYIICVQIKLVTPADRTAADRALASLSVNY